MSESQPGAAERGGDVVLTVEDLAIDFNVSRSLAQLVQGEARQLLRAVDRVSLDVRRFETLGLVGESGCGKTTLGRALLRLYRPSAGRIEFLGRDLAGLRRAELRALRSDMQMVFQDPYSSLNPRMTVGQTIGEVLRFHNICARAESAAEVAKLLDLVGLSGAMAGRYPGTLSGGQRQRVGLARALAVRPSFIVLDEPVAALDVSIQAQILNLLKDLGDELGLTMMFIAHELSVVRHMSSRLAVMYLGKIVELSSSEDLYKNTLHPYTKALLSAIPVADPDKRNQRIILEGDVPNPVNPPSGCAFHPRCPRRGEGCDSQVPQLVNKGRDGTDHLVACHYAGV